MIKEGESYSLPKLKHLVSIRDVDKVMLNNLLERAKEFRSILLKGEGCDVLKHRVLASVFFEPSTRTNCSFQAAMLRLGGSVITLEEATSSSMKGETLEDTIQTLSCYCDAIVLRHPSVTDAAKVATIPLINAGDGINQHPTQALLDLFTIQVELGSLSNNGAFNIAFIGDLHYGRTVHSLVALLAANFEEINFMFVASNELLQIPSEFISQLNQTKYKMYSNLDDIIDVIDVLYVTRIQKERFSNEKEYFKCHIDSIIIDNNIMNKAKKNMIVMHPLPRVNEIAIEVDNDPRAAYFRQIKYGMYMRMAILELLINYNEKNSC